MARACRQLEEDIKLTDLVVELLDARIPDSSGNPFLQKLAGRKQRLVLLHKADQGEPDVTSRWLSFFGGEGIDALPFTVHHPRSSKTFFDYLKKKERTVASGRLKRPLRLIVVGIPNVGKSTLINYLVKKAVARAGNRPGITRGRQWIRLLPGIELLDTPGVLLPRLSEEAVLPLAVVGALPAGKVDLQSAARWLITAFIQKGKGERLLRRYPDLELSDPDKTLAGVASGRGFLLPGGKIDLERAAAFLLKDYQSGSLGRLTLEEPPQDDREQPEEGGGVPVEF